MSTYDERPLSHSTRKLKVISQEMLLGSTGQITRYSRETNDNYLKRVTHLHLQGKRIGNISNLEMCPNLKVLYLYDNHIEKIENLEVADKLEQLYLNNNQIKEMGQLKAETLTKLHLEDNELTFIVGLDTCEKLSELYISNQRILPYLVLEFDTFSLRAIAKSLEVLDISGDRISTLSQFMLLKNLRIFLCENNRVDDITEVEMILGLPALVETSFLGNPVCSLPKYRDRLIAVSRNSLVKLDQIEIPMHQKVAIKGLVKHRQNLKSSITE